MFKTFAKQYGFTHLTSSPWYLQGNGATERLLELKTLLEKSDKPYITFMAYAIYIVQPHSRKDIAPVSYSTYGEEIENC